MLSPERARAVIVSSVSPLGAETVPLARAIGRVCAYPLRALAALPSFDNSTMDGYAVRAADLAGASPRVPVALKLVGTAAAGMPSTASAVRAGEAMRIMTGAPLPRGADAVVMKESSLPKTNGRVSLVHAPKPGEWVRPRGQDARAGELMLEAGKRLRPYEIGLLAAQGISSLAVRRRPRAAVLSTGSELVALPRRLGFGQIRDCNGPALLSALAASGVAALDLGIVPDDLRRLKASLDRALDRADAVLVSGGVSVGDFDFTSSAFKALGVRVVFWKVRLKPGKPLLFGLARRGGRLKPVFGLPGNPVSSLVCFSEFVKPALERMEGLPAEPDPYHLSGEAANGFELPRNRSQLLFCSAAGSGPKGFRLTILKPQASHLLARCSKANVLAKPRAGTRRVRPGDKLFFRFLS